MSSDRLPHKSTSVTSAESANDQAERDLSVDEVEAEIVDEIDRSTGGTVDRGLIGKAVHTVLERREVYTGPLPHPKHFQQFEETHPGAAGEILDMAKREQNHRHGWEHRYLTFDGAQGILGQVLGFLGLIALIGGALMALSMGSELIASLLVGASVIGVVTAIIRGRPMRVPQQQQIEPAPSKSEREQQRPSRQQRRKKR